MPKGRRGRRGERQGGVEGGGGGRGRGPLFRNTQQPFDRQAAGWAADLLTCARLCSTAFPQISGYLISASLCSSMGPGIPLNVAALVAAAQAARKAE